MTPPLVAFYAYKGGTGCTTSLAQVAWALAREGRRVVAIDLDLPAPGLAPLFDAPSATRGFVDLAREWHRARTCNVLDACWSVPLDAQASGRLFVIPAGRIDEDYLAFLQSLDWQALISPEVVHDTEAQADLPAPRKHFLQMFRERIVAEFSPDVILIDAPTGFSDTANVVLQVLADAVVLCFAPTRIQLEGVGRVAYSLVRAACDRRDAGEPQRPELLCVASMLMSRRGEPTEMERVQTAFRYLRDVRLAAQNSFDARDGQAIASVEQEPAVVAYQASLSDIDQLETSCAPRPDDVAVVGDILRFVRTRLPA